MWVSSAEPASEDAPYTSWRIRKLVCPFFDTGTITDTEMLTTTVMPTMAMVELQNITGTVVGMAHLTETVDGLQMRVSLRSCYVHTKMIILSSSQNIQPFSRLTLTFCCKIWGFPPSS